jgi:hypothetical protein
MELAPRIFLKHHRILGAKDAEGKEWGGREMMKLE